MFPDVVHVLISVVLVLANGFFVAAEFAFIKTRPHRLEDLVRVGRPFARTARWLQRRLDSTLAACQLGITMASLALGWVGEPAFARLLEPLFRLLSIESEHLLHGIAFATAFTVITSLHLVAGEQVPKILAIRRCETLALWCAPAMKAFYFASFPFLWALSSTTAGVLRRFGVEESTGHEAPHTEDEIRALLTLARAAGELTGTEHKLLHAVFEFDDTVCRRIMLPRREVVHFDVKQSVRECLDIARRTKHTRYPVCEGSLDEVLGVVHMKDLVGVVEPESFELRDLLRPPHRVPETMPISRLLRHFQATRQHLAFVVDEFGNVIGIVTLENVLEQIVGPVEDEFDAEPPMVIPDGSGYFVVLGGASIAFVNRRTGLRLPEEEADTLSGLITSRLGRMPQVGDRLEIGGASIQVLEVASSRASRVRLTRAQLSDESPKPG